MTTPCPLDNVRIVLSHTSHPGNIGATARAMKTMGLSSLYLINPRLFPDREADARAVSARDILDKIKICTELDEALLDKEHMNYCVTHNKNRLRCYLVLKLPA